jgi:hypothetical protein
LAEALVQRIAALARHSRFGDQQLGIFAHLEEAVLLHHPVARLLDILLAVQDIARTGDGEQAHAGSAKERVAIAALVALLLVLLPGLSVLLSHRGSLHLLE